MEYLGRIQKKPFQNKNNKWNYVEIQCENVEEFNDLTVKVMNVMHKTNSDGKCIVVDGKGDKFLLEIIHSTFDTFNFVVKLLPYNSIFIGNEKDKQQQDKKPQAPKTV